MSQLVNTRIPICQDVIGEDDIGAAFLQHVYLDFQTPHMLPTRHGF